MKRVLLEYLVCPSCQSDLQADLSAPEPDGEYMSGTLQCSNCRRQYPISGGVPRMVVTAQEHRGAAETFGFEWRKHGEKQLEGETVFGRTQDQDVAYFLDATQMAPKQVRDAVILDAGCGSGQLTEGIGQMGAKAVIGIDVNSAIDFPFQRCRHLPNVHIAQADILALPFRSTQSAQFDLTWCQGVIHHSSNPPKAFDCLAAVVKPQGKLYLWVYEKRWSPFVFTYQVLDTMGILRLPLPIIYRLCKVLAVLSFTVHSIYRTIRWLPPLRPESYATAKTTRFRSVGELELTWFDTLSPKYNKTYTKREVIEWFVQHRFGNLVMYPDQIGICGVKH